MKTKLDTGVRELVAASPFFASLLLRLERKDGECAGMQTDGEALIVNPSWIEEQRTAQIKGALAAAALRCGLKHPYRRDGRDARLWSEASAIVVNGIVDEAGMELPNGEPIRRDLDGLSIEQVYSVLLKEQPEPTPQPDQNQEPDCQPDDDGDDEQPAQGGDQEPGDEDQDGDQDEDGPEAPGEGDGDQGAPGGDQDGAGDGGDPQPSCTEVLDGATGSDAEEIEETSGWDIAMLQASEAAKARGSEPAGLEQYLDDLREPNCDWQTLFRRFMQDVSRTNYNWSRPNRSLLARGIRMPSLHEPSMGPLLIVLDTSVSIDLDVLADAGGEFRGIMQSVIPSSVTILHCDTTIHKVERWEPSQYQDFELTAVGRGGTDLRPFVQWIEEEAEEQPALVVYFTDLDGPLPDEESIAWPMIWATYNTNEDGPGGETVRMDR